MSNSGRLRVMKHAALKRYIQGVIVLLFLSLAVPGGIHAAEDLSQNSVQKS